MGCYCCCTLRQGRRGSVRGRHAKLQIARMEYAGTRCDVCVVVAAVKFVVCSIEDYQMFQT